MVWGICGQCIMLWGVTLCWYWYHLVPWCQAPSCERTMVWGIFMLTMVCGTTVRGTMLCGTMTCGTMMGGTVVCGTMVCDTITYSAAPYWEVPQHMVPWFEIPWVNISGSFLWSINQKNVRLRDYQQILYKRQFFGGLLLTPIHSHLRPGSLPGN